MKINDDGWLEEEGENDPRIVLYPSERHYGLEVPAPLGIVWHYTAGQGDGNAEYEYDHPDHAGEDLAKRLTRPGGRSASWHFLIAKDGDVFQSVSALKGSWHVGKPGRIAGRQFANINRATIGVELENAGRLKHIDGAWYCWPYFRLDPRTGQPSAKLGGAPNCLITDDRAGWMEDGQPQPTWKGACFDKFTAEQETSAALLLGALVEKFGWAVDVCSYGHVLFDPANREDPGPIFRGESLPRILAAVFDAEVT